MCVSTAHSRSKEFHACIHLYNLILDLSWSTFTAWSAYWWCGQGCCTISKPGSNFPFWLPVSWDENMFSFLSENLNYVSKRLLTFAMKKISTEFAPEAALWDGLLNLTDSKITELFFIFFLWYFEHRCLFLLFNIFHTPTRKSQLQAISMHLQCGGASNFTTEQSSLLDQVCILQIAWRKTWVQEGRRR